MFAMFRQRPIIGLALLLIILPSIAESLKCLIKDNSKTLKTQESSNITVCGLAIMVTPDCRNYAYHYFGWTDERIVDVFSLKKNLNPDRTGMITKDIRLDVFRSEGAVECFFSAQKSMKFDGSYSQFEESTKLCADDKCQNFVLMHAKSIAFAKGGRMEAAKVRALKSAVGFPGYKILLSIFTILSVYHI